MRFLFFFILALTLLAPSSHAGIKDWLSPAKLKEEIKREIAELDIKFKVDLVDLNLAEGIGISSRYRYEVEPSYMDGWYNRMDKWILKANLNPGDLLSDVVDLPISINIENGTEIIFVRQFKSKKKALTALPYTFARLPLKAKWARKNLKPGDFVSIPTRLNIVVGAGLSFTEGVFGAGINSHYLLSGEFQAHIFRMKNDKVRVKLIALRRRGKGVGATAGVEFKIFGIGIIDKKIKRFVDLDLARFGLSKEHGNLFLLDYTFDLKDEPSRKAYDQILSSTFKFKNLKILNPFKSHKEVGDELITDLTLTEEIFKEDREKPEAERRIDRIFKGSNEFERKSSNWKLGFNLIKYSKENIYTENQISYTDRDDKQHHFFFPTHTVIKKNKFLFGLSKTQKVINYFALWPTDAQGRSLDPAKRLMSLESSQNELGQPLGYFDDEGGPDFKDFGMSMDVKDKRMWGSEQKYLKEFFMRNIPGWIYDQIEWGEWNENKKRYNVRIFFQAIIHRVALGDLQRSVRSGLKHRLDTFMDTVPLPDPRSSNTNDWEDDETWQEQNSWKLRKMVKGLDEALTEESAMSDKQRIKKLMELRKNGAFQELGLGFLISLLDHRSLNKNIYVSLHASAKDTKSVDFEFGDHELKELYKELQYVQGVLNNRSFDMRLVKEQTETGQKLSGPAPHDLHDGEEGPEPEIKKGPLNKETSAPEFEAQE